MGYAAPLDSAKQRIVTLGDTGLGWSSSGSHLDLPQIFMWARANQLTLWGFKYSQSSLYFLMSGPCLFSGLGLAPAACSRLSSEWLYCKHDHHQTQGTGETIPAEEHRDLEENICISTPVSGSTRVTLLCMHISQRCQGAPRRVVISKWP